ncbi:MFS transporter [Bacillus sonorensis]|uniref:Major facilitator superfamily protein YwoG n=1 Tax=Bacillus sonorensis L12 TaxID=1274524 RepID=M5PD42_9BACI|nr:MULTISPECIES: MFS transporter [Bacillus]TWK80644.1 Purine efflux pump PbuE [Bacillus paralicheniformis]EME73447.1 major facilitator superfamily protein YwoG [Bacillus sonorensis L12]MCZ0072743.1 MFS transporter [Bacillus sonorensis]MCZ0091364.1 MFS transporter [Bacillus sonorensis]MEC0341371.1 MFS transporter [Bacillus sonorensis]
MKQSEPIWTRDFIMVVLINLFIFVYFYAFLTVLPVYTMQELGGSESQGGLLISGFMLSAIFARPFSGAVIERFGKKRMALLSVILFTLSSFLYIVIQDIYVLLGLRFFQGIWFSIITTVTSAIAADLIPAARRGEGLGYFAMSMNLAVVIGPFIALNLLNNISFTALFALFSGVVTIGILCTALVRIPKGNDRTSAVFKLSFSNMFEKGALRIATVGLFVSFCYSSVISFISVYAKSLGLIETSSYFFIVFAVAMMVTRPFTGKLYDKVGPGVVIYPSIIIFSIGLCLLAFTNSSGMLLLSGAVIGMGYGSITPCLQTLAIQASPKHRSGYATATYFTLFDSGIAVGSFVFGLVVSQTGFSNIYLFTGIFVLINLFLYTWSQKSALLKEEQNISIAD